MQESWWRSEDSIQESILSFHCGFWGCNSGFCFTPDISAALAECVVEGNGVPERGRSEWEKLEQGHWETNWPIIKFWFSNGLFHTPHELLSFVPALWLFGFLFFETRSHCVDLADLELWDYRFAPPSLANTASRVSPLETQALISWWHVGTLSIITMRKSKHVHHSGCTGVGKRSNFCSW